MILRHGKIREVSFTPTGVDDSTHAAILSDDKATESTDVEPKTLAEALLKINALTVENARLKKENAKLKGIESKAKTDDKLATAGFLKDIYGNFKGLSKQSYNVLLSLSDVQAEAMIKDLSQSPIKTALPDYLLRETAVSSGNNQRESSDKIDHFLQAKGVYR